MNKKKYIRGFILSLILTFGIISVFTFSTGIEENIQKLKTFIIYFAFLGILMMVVKWIAETWILKISLFEHKDKFGFFSLMRIVIIGNLFNYLTPFFTGGQPVLVYYLSQKGIKPGEATASIIYKSMIFQIVMTVFGITGVVYSYIYLNLESTLIILAGTLLNGFVIFLILLFSLSKEKSLKIVKSVTMLLKKIKIVKKPEDMMEKIVNNVEAFVNMFKTNSKKIPQFLSVFALSSVQVLTYIFSIIFVLMGFKIDFNIDLFFKSLVLDIGAAIVPTPGTAGAAEGFYYLIFSETADIFTINTSVFIWRLVTYYFVIFVGIILFILRPKKTGDS